MRLEMTTETSIEKTIRYLTRESFDEVNFRYLNTAWTSYKELMDYFKVAGWTTRELIEYPQELNDIIWYLTTESEFDSTYLTKDEIAKFESSICNGIPTIVRTVHGPYTSEIVVNSTFNSLLRCVNESLLVNKDPLHCVVGSFPIVEIINDSSTTRHQVLTFVVGC